MILYHLECDIVVKAYTTVEASTLQEAIEISECRCALMSGSGGDDVNVNWVINNPNVIPTQIKQA